jgi:hypothetical protein
MSKRRIFVVVTAVRTSDPSKRQSVYDRVEGARGRTGRRLQFSVVVLYMEAEYVLLILGDRVF